MGGVVDAIGDAVGSVVDAVGDAVEWVGDTVSNVVQAAIDDPLKTVVQVAAVATGNAWALPVIEGVDVLEEGGSIEDALKGAALTYAVQTGVNFAMDSFGTPGVTETSGTTQFFDDGSSIQFFDDGSTLVTDSAGGISSTPATDIASGFAEAGVPTDVAADATLTSPDVEIFPLGETGAPEITPIAGTEAVTPEVLASTTTTPQFETMEELLQNIGEMPPEVVGDVGTGQDFFQFDDGSTLQTFDDGSTIATDIDGNLSASPATNLPDGTDIFGAVSSPDFGATDTGAITGDTVGDVAGVVTDGGAAPITDLSFPFDPTDVPPSLTEGLTDLGGAVIDTITENPITSTVVGAGILGAVGGGEKPTTTPTKEEVKKTYQYQAAPVIGETKGLEQLWSAAQSIYGDKLTEMLGIGPTTTPSSSGGNFQPLLGGPAPGGIATLPRTYTPMSGGQTFDVSTLTPEQIILLQNLVERKRGSV